jgi:hypothetical protein
MYDSADHTAAIDVSSFLLIVYEGFVGESAFPATVSPVTLMKMAVESARPIRWMRR